MPIPEPNRIESSRISQVDRKLAIVSDIISAGGAATKYEVWSLASDGEPEMLLSALKFHQGDPAEVGVTGITNEALLAILISRMEGFLKGPFHSPLNVEALQHLRSALACLENRTRDRMARQVDGKQKP